MRKAIVTAGVSYHYALTQPGQPLSNFELLDVHSLGGVELIAATNLDLDTHAFHAPQRTLVGPG